MTRLAGELVSFPADIDPITEAEIRELISLPGPKVSIHLPTHRHGPEVRQGPVRLAHLLAEARTGLAAHGVSDADSAALLDPVEALVGRAEFWQHQASALSIMAAPGRHAVHRVPVELPEIVMVGENFHLTPLVPLIAGDGHFLVLAVSQNMVQALMGDRWHLGPLDTRHAPDAIPSSMAEALAHEDLERQLQQHSTGSGAAQFHGHGSGSELDKATVERYLRLVDHGLAEVLAGLPGSADWPLVLASVGYLQPIYRSLSRHRLVMPTGLEGNPEHLTLEALHTGTWSAVAEHFETEVSAALARFDAALGTGAALAEPFEIAARATEGRVDTLLVDATAPFGAKAVVDSALTETLRHGGRILSAAVPGGVGALLRY